MESANGTFFTQVDFFDANGSRAYDSTFVMAINETTNEFVDWVIYPEAYAFGWGSFITNFSRYVEEDGFLYISAFMGRLFSEGMDPITLRIDVANLAFDSNWSINYDAYAGGPPFITGGGVYLDGKLYAIVMSQAAAPDFSDFGANMHAVEIDIATQAITRIQGIPTIERGSPISPVVYQGKVYFPHQGESGNPTFSYYTYDPSNQATEQIFSMAAGLVQKLYIIE